MGRGAAAQRRAALPSRCPQTTSARGDGSAAATLSPRCRSIYLHLYDDLPRFFSTRTAAPTPAPHPSHLRPPLSVTHSAEGIQRSDNEIMTHPFQPFKSGPFYFPPSHSALSFLILSLSIFSYSLVLMRPGSRSGWAGPGWAWAHLFVLGKWLKMHRKVEELKRSKAFRRAKQELDSEMSPPGGEHGAVQHFDRRGRLGWVELGREGGGASPRD